MKKQNLRIEKVTKQIAKHITEQEAYGWPPLCPALCYQPVRPKKEKAAQQSREQYTGKL